MKKESVTIGMIQSGPVYLDLEKTMEKAATLVEEAVAKGAEMVVFGETWLSGYPAWLDLCPETAVWDNEAAKEVFAQMHENSVTVSGKEIDSFRLWARNHKIVIVLGLNEKVETGIGNGTIYNSIVVIDEKGEIRNHHRKLMPTFSEKLVYGIGDGHGLKASETHLGRIGALVCWEHWMPLTRQAMHNSCEHIHIALWPWVHEMHQIASRQYAFEGRCFVVAVGQIMRVSDLPKQLKLPEHLTDKTDELILKGASSIIAPNGKYLMEPQLEKDEVLIHKIENLNQVYKERMTLDTSGHYNRTDVFNFSVNPERASWPK